MSFSLVIFFTILVSSVAFEVTKTEDLTFQNVTICFIESVETESHFCQLVNARSIKDVINNKEIYAVRAHKVFIPVLYKHSITDLESVRLISINNVRLKKIEAHTFGGLKQLSLNLEHNDLTEISENVFTNVQGITELLIGHNKINNIHPKAFNNMKDLSLLRLSFNKLKYWDSNWLIGSPVTDLYVNHNHIRELPPHAFKYVKFSPIKIEKIMYVNFENNNLTRLENRMIVDIGRVKFFRVSGNPLTEIDEKLCDDVIIEELRHSGLRKATNCDGFLLRNNV